MAGAAGTMPHMPKEKPKRGRPQGRRQTVSLYARVDPDLAQVWNDYVESLRPKTSSNSMIELLIEDYLRAKGLWPPPPAEQD